MANKKVDISSHLPWKFNFETFDFETFDFEKSKSSVIERVVERGSLEDGQAI